jgi:hypothetical protein
MSFIWGEYVHVIKYETTTTTTTTTTKNEDDDDERSIYKQEKRQYTEVLCERKLN